jgi:energy-coupling factor transport system permease protein
MTTAVGFYVPGQSWLYRLDPRAKLWLSLLGVGLCLLTARLDVLAAALAMAHLVLIAGGLPPGKLALVWRRVLIILVAILVLQPIISPGPEPPIAQLGPLRVTQSGLLLGLRYALRVAAAAFFALIPIMTTPINLLVRGLQKIGLPYVWGAAIGLGLRYLGTIGELYATIAEAQAARGWDPASGGPIRRARAAAPALIALVIASLRLTDSLALGMAARGFGLNRTRTWRQDIAMSNVDWVAMGISAAVFIAMVYLIVNL